MRKLNVRLAAILAGSVIVVAVLVYFVREMQVRRNAGFYKTQAETALEEAEQAAETGNYQKAAQRYDDAVDNYRWYVRLRPSDVDAREDLALLLADLAEERGDRRTAGNAYARLEEVLRADPARSEVRRELARLMILMGRWADAEENVRVLLESDPDDAKTLELLGLCQEALREDAAAAATYRTLIETHPDRLASYTRLAMLLRSRLERPAEADQCMTSMIEANAESGEAHRIYADYLQRRRQGREDAETVRRRREKALEHARRAIELEPAEASGYRLAALCATALGQFDEARDFARRAIELKPDDQRMHATLVDVELRAGRRDEALAALRQGLEAAENHADLQWTLANLLIDAGQLDDARKNIAELKQVEYSKGRIGYLEARIDLVQENWREAIEGFAEIRPALVAWPGLAKQADFWTAECYHRLGNPDMRLKFLRRVVDTDPFFVPALTGIAEAELAVGQIEEAYRQYVNLIKMGGRGVGPEFARVLVLRELQKPANQRDWDTVESMLRNAAESNPNSPQIPIYLAEVLMARGNSEEAKQLLLEARDRMPQAVELWGVLASMAGKQGDWDEAAALLKEAEEHVNDRVGIQLARARYFVDRYGGRAGDQLRKMTQSTGSLSEAEKIRLWKGILSEAMEAGANDLAEELARRVASLRPGDVDVRFLLFELAVRQRELEKIERELEELRRVVGEGAMWFYGQAVRISMVTREPDDPQLDVALDYLRQARAARPSWGRAVLLSAGIYDQKGDHDRALDLYLQAVRMGEKNPRALRRAIQLLYAQRRFHEAIRLMEDFGSVPAELTRAYSEMKFRTDRFDEALKLAEKAAVGSEDPNDHIWLGQVSMVEALRARQRGELVDAEKALENAEAAFLKATELADDVAATWAALIRFYTATNQPTKAEQAVGRAETKLPAEKSAIALAQCFEAMRDFERAQEKYEEALAASPRDPVTVRYAANFYLRTGNIQAGEEKLRRLVEGDIPAGKSDRLWARRRLAMLLATRPGYQRRQEALALIEQNLAEESDSVADRRMKAEVLARDPSSESRQAAIRMLEQLLEGKDATAEDLFDLYELHVGEGNWVEAARSMRQLLADHGPQPRFLIPFIETLLKRRELSEAERWIDRLAEVMPNSSVVVQFRAELMVQNNRPSEATRVLVEFVDTQPATPPDRMARMQLMADKLDELGRRLEGEGNAAAAAGMFEAAERLYRDYVAARPGESLRLATFLARRGSIDEALDIVEEHWKSGTPVSTAQALVVLLKSQAATPEQLDRADRVLVDALEAYNRPVPLLLVTADFRSRQQRYAEAEACYREIIAQRPNDAIAMNNLAVLLALQGRKVDEALELIQAAIKIAGPVAAMLDSRASVHLARGKAQEAIADLTTALDERPTPVRRFHLAQAYDMAGQRAEAAAAMREAVDAGLTEHQLHPLERPAFGRLKKLAE